MSEIKPLELLTKLRETVKSKGIIIGETLDQSKVDINLKEFTKINIDTINFLCFFSCIILLHIMRH